MAEQIHEIIGDERSCEICHSTENLKRCSGCHGIFYCSKEHQFEGWNKHKQNCKKSKGSLPGAQKENGYSSTTTTSCTNDAGKMNVHVHVHVQPQTRTVPNTSNEGGSTNSTKLKIPPAKVEQTISSTKSSLRFDPRPFVQVEFPCPASRDGDTLARHVGAHLQRDGFCVVDSFLAVKEGQGVLEEVKSIHSSGVLVDGPLSGGRTSSQTAKKFTEKDIRGDKITWLQGNEECHPNISALVHQMDELIQRLNYYLQEHYTISGRTKVMVACYPGNGAGYACHVDNPNRDGRCVTCLYYLNKDWDVKTHGGLLRILPVTGGHVDIQPLLNRLLLFWSDRRTPHEVQPAYDMRFAITIWYFDKKEREEAKMAELSEDMSRLRGEVSLFDDIKTRKDKKDKIEHKIQETSTGAVAGLSCPELQALSTLLQGQSDPRALLTSLDVAPSIQDALLCQLEVMKSSGKS